jgi:hypothetical protein
LKKTWLKYTETPGADDRLDALHQRRRARQLAHGRAMVVRVVQLAQHRACLDAAIDVPGALCRRQLGEEGLAPGLDVVDQRLGGAGVDQARHREVAGVPVDGQVAFAQAHRAAPRVVTGAAQAPVINPQTVNYCTARSLCRQADPGPRQRQRQPESKPCGDAPWMP